MLGNNCFQKKLTPSTKVTSNSGQLGKTVMKVQNSNTVRIRKFVVLYPITNIFMDKFCSDFTAVN